jgi:acyl-CoA reductase-like NAD-dependent aldehyde dehydrogenase
MTMQDDLSDSNQSIDPTGQPRAAPAQISVFNPYTGELIGAVPNARGEEVRSALELGIRASTVCRALPSAKRAAILAATASDIADRADEFVRCIVGESGKTVRQARKEVLRCVNTLTLCAEEAKRLRGETIPFASFAGSESRQGYFQRDPLGLIVGITPYNDPLNLAAHKVGPALAAGNAIILKPAELAPFSAIMLADALARAGLPHGILSVVTGDGETGRALVSAKEVRMVSFTGGTRTAHKIARAAGLKRLAMDLGGNAPVIVMQIAICHRQSKPVCRGHFGLRVKIASVRSEFSYSTRSTTPFSTVLSPGRELLYWVIPWTSERT